MEKEIPWWWGEKGTWSTSVCSLSHQLLEWGSLFPHWGGADRWVRRRERWQKVAYSCWISPLFFQGWNFILNHSLVTMCMLSHSAESDSLRHHGLQTARLITRSDQTEFRSLLWPQGLLNSPKGKFILPFYKVKDWGWAAWWKGST